eukprot:scaffold18677_cov41-Prasinocladus_malaysianus.AAC.2
MQQNLIGHHLDRPQTSQQQDLEASKLNGREVQRLQAELSASNARISGLTEELEALKELDDTRQDGKCTNLLYNR